MGGWGGGGIGSEVREGGGIGSGERTGGGGGAMGKGNEKRKK